MGDRVVVRRRVARKSAARGVGLELLYQHGRAGDSLERRPAHEVQARGRLDHADRMARRGREPDQLNGLVGGDPAAYAKQDPGQVRLLAVAVLDLPGGDLLEGDLEVVLR